MPFKGQMHVDQLLSNVSVKYSSNEFIAQNIFPVVPVIKDSDKYRVYQVDFRLPETRKANKGLAPEHYWEASTAGYNLQDHALKDFVTDDDIDNFDQGDLRADTVEELTDVILRRLEKSTFDLFTSSNWSLNTSLAATALWSLDTTLSNPLPVVDTAAAVVLRNSGKMVNYGVISHAGYIAAKNHQSIVDRIKYTQTGIISEQLLGTLFGVPEFYVSKAQIDTSDRGRTSTVSAIFSDACFFGYKPARATPKAPSAGYIFRKNVPIVRRWREEERLAEAIEVRIKYDAKIVASLAGYLINNIE